MNLSQNQTLEHWQVLEQLAALNREERELTRDLLTKRAEIRSFLKTHGCRKTVPWTHKFVRMMAVLVLFTLSANAATNDPVTAMRELKRKAAITQKTTTALTGSRAGSAFAVVVQPEPPARTNIVLTWDQPDGAGGLMTLPVSWLEYDLVCSTNSGKTWFIEATTNAPPVKVRIKYPVAAFRVGWHYK